MAEMRTATDKMVQAKNDVQLRIQDVERQTGATLTEFEQMSQLTEKEQDKYRQQLERQSGMADGELSRLQQEREQLQARLE